MISILSNFVNKVAHILKYQVVHSYKGIEKLKGTWAVTSKFNTTVQSGSNIKTQWPKWCRQPFRNGLIIVASLSWLSRLFPDWKFILHKLRRFPRILIKFLKYFIKMSSYHHIISAIIWHLTTPSYKKNHLTRGIFVTFCWKTLCCDTWEYMYKSLFLNINMTDFKKFLMRRLGLHA